MDQSSPSSGEWLQVFDTPDQIAMAQFFARRALLRLEIKGIKRHGRPASVICKEAYNLTGTPKQVLAQMDRLVEQTRPTTTS
jgi:hypothetical protein